MSIQIDGAEKSLLDIQLKVLQSSKKALVKISQENPFKTVRYQRYAKPKEIEQYKGKINLSDNANNVFLCFLEGNSIWIPAAFKPSYSKKYKLSTDRNSMEISGGNLKRIKEEVRFYFNPQNEPAGTKISRNVEGIIKKFLEQVVENPTQQKPFSSTHDCKNGIKVEEAGFSNSDVFWFKTESPSLVKETMYPAFNLYEIQKQIDATENWRKRPPAYARQLKNFFEPYPSTGAYLEGQAGSNWETRPIAWKLLTDPGREGALEQRDFVLKALNTPDIALLEGPPGSGKTTVILELILQLLGAGKRVLLSSATHVAIDNVLERLYEQRVKEKSNLGILGLRIASNETRMSKVVKDNFHDQTLIEKAKRDTEELLYSLPGKTIGQNMLLSREGKLDEKEFRHFLLNSANLVAGTLVGLLQHEGLKDRQPDFKPFDYLIVDEASKVTLSGFLVPAMWASRWVLVGDTKQLAPYSDGALIETILVNEQELKVKEAETLVQLISDAFGYRQHELEAPKKIARLERELNSYPDHIENELFWLSQTYLPSVFELFQDGIPGWLQAEDSKFGLFRGIPKVLERPVSMDWGHIAFEDDLSDPEPWTNRFQSLSYQHRMVEELARIPHLHMYNGKNMFTSRKAEEQSPKLLNLLGHKDDRACTWIEVTHNGTSQHGNQPEGKSVLTCLDQIEQHLSQNPVDHKVEIAIITFYRAQEKFLKKALEHRKKVKGLEIQLKTVDSVQGQEADIVLLCFTTWGENRFYNVPNRLNVALTRAKKRLFLFGDPASIKEYTNSPALIALCKHTNVQFLKS